jgi:hypothetical protein
MKNRESEESNVKIPTAYNQKTLEVLWGISIILKYDPFVKIRVAQNIIYFGAYNTKELMSENEQISMESWGWQKKDKKLGI